MKHDVSTVLVATSCKLSALPKMTYQDFDRFVEVGDWLISFWKEVCDLELDDERVTRSEVKRAECFLAAWPKMQNKTQDFNKYEHFYNRPALYEKDGWGPISRRVVKEQISLLIDGYRTKHGDDDGDLDAAGKIMVEEVLCAAPSACALESACRHLRRNNKYMPRISEVLKAIEQQEEKWASRWDAGESYTNDGRWLDNLRRGIADARARLDAADAREAEIQAKHLLINERRVQQMQAEDARRKQQLTLEASKAAK